MCWQAPYILVISSNLSVSLASIKFARRRYQLKAKGIKVLSENRFFSVRFAAAMFCFARFPKLCAAAHQYASKKDLKCAGVLSKFHVLTNNL